MKPIKAFWFMSNNFGDALNVWLVERITGHKPLFVSPEEGTGVRYLVVGSILNWAVDNCVVWGPGLASYGDCVSPKAQICSVRGPLSRKRAIECGAECPEIYGDPALLLPRFYQARNPDVKFPVGIIPHYKDQELVYERWGESHKIINVFDPVEEFIDNVCSCEKILSSSLHGLVVSDAYGIPSCWVEFSDNVGGDGMKFLDHFLSVGIDPYVPVRMEEVSYWPELSYATASVDTEKLWGACPFK